MACAASQAHARRSPGSSISTLPRLVPPDVALARGVSGDVWVDLLEARDIDVKMRAAKHLRTAAAGLCVCVCVCVCVC